MNASKTWMKVILIIVLLLIAVPLAIFIFIQFAPREVPAQVEAVTAEASDGKTAAHRERHARRENRTARQKTTFNEPEPEQNFEGVGAVVPNAPRSKQATPYRPGTVPGDSGVMVQYAGSPDDMASGPQPPPPDDPWDGAVLPPMTPEQMRGIGGVRRINPDDPFFQQDIPNPFANQ